MKSDSQNVSEIFCAARKLLKGKNYLIAVPIPFFESDDGSIWVDGLWYKDLIAHLDYIDEIRVLAPCIPYDGQSGLTKIQPADSARLEFIALPFVNSMRQAIFAFPKTVMRSARAVTQSDVVHSGIAGWPIPIGVVVNPLAVLFRKPLIIVVESAFWRLADEQHASIKRRIRASLTEMFARWSVKNAILAVFTHSTYKKSLAGNSRAETLISPACWIVDGDILSDEKSQTIWKKKLTKTPRILLAARLTREKGIQLALDALETLENCGEAVELDIIGQGDLRESCLQLASMCNNVDISVLDPVEYGPDFFSLLQDYHAVLVPSLSDEQPRIIFDAFSQAVPVIASDSPGHIDIIENDQTGWLFKVGDRSALCTVLKKARSDGEGLREMGETALCRSRNYTHRSMHLRRAKALTRVL